MGTTLLWALRSPCNLQCQYCYFGTIQTTPAPAERGIGTLTHYGTDDATLDDLLRFVTHLTPNSIKRAFLAGGEPLVWNGTFDVARALKRSGAEVVICTNGLPLQATDLVETLFDIGIDAVSVSLDSHDPDANDRWRTDASGVGWRGVVAGLRTLLAKRAGRRSPRVGVYMVVTAENIAHIGATARFVAELGVDYFIFQPISLVPSHPLHARLALTPGHVQQLAAEIEHVQRLDLQVILPDRAYLRLVLKTLATSDLLFVRACFGGRDLFFIQPDGTIWDCPSMYKIALRAKEGAPVTIRSSLGVERAAGRVPPDSTDCDCLSVDCVNMWQLMAFDSILTGGIDDER